MSKKFFKLSLIMLLALGLTSITFAQGRQTGSISGTVVDEEGNPLPGATVILTGKAVMGSLTYVTGETGKFRFPSLLPGGCEVRVEMPGFKTTTRKGLIIRVGKTTEITITLAMTTIEEEVTVTAASPVVDVETSKVSINYTSEFLASLPMNRDLYGIQNSIPGAVSEGVDYRRTSSILGGTVR
ncbi:MAG: carboxypeptidase-like regulatory domain-containing protein, partial [Candidatus Aminicenantaceae bacterium]